MLCTASNTKKKDFNSPQGAQQKVFSFLPEFSSGVLISPKTPHRSPQKGKKNKSNKKTSASSSTSSPTQVSNQQMKLESSNSKGNNFESPSRRDNFSYWLAPPCSRTPSPNKPNAPRSASKRSESRTLPNRSSRKYMPTAPLTRDAQGDSTNTLLTYGSVDTFLEGYDPTMSYQFPMCNETQKLVFRKQPKQRDIVIETNTGIILGSIDFIEDGTTLRFLNDAAGNTCAIILQTRDKSVGGGNIFQVYSNTPAVSGQETSKKKMTNGYYLWAEMKNTGVIGGKFVMKRYSSETSSCSDGQHIAQPFGSLFAKDKTKGYTFLDEGEKECTKMISLTNRDKGIAIAPNRDTGLMLAFCAVVDEMVERRLR